MSLNNMAICNTERNYPPLVGNMRDGLNGLRMKQTKTTTWFCLFCLQPIPGGDVPCVSG